jgi:hypothetical protein
MALAPSKHLIASQSATNIADCDALLSRWDLAPDARSHVLRNAAAHVANLADLVPHADLIQLNIPTPAGWNAYNPSIASTAHGLLMTVRSSNWEFKRHYYFRVNADDGVPRSRSYVVVLDSDLAPKAVNLLQDGTDRTGEGTPWCRGYEDLRLFEHRGRLRAIATSADFSPTGKSQMALLDIIENRLLNRRLLSDGVSRAEKNWSPAIWNDELFLVYAFAPMALVRWDGSRLLRAGLESYFGPPIAVDFRGGSQLISIDDGFLTVVHMGADFPDGSRIYLHRFVTLDAEFRIVGVSPPFTFREQGVEFAAGLAIQDGFAIVSFGVSDMECWMMRLPLAHVLGLVSPPVESDPEARPKSVEKQWPATTR